MLATCLISRLLRLPGVLGPMMEVRRVREQAQVIGEAMDVRPEEHFAGHPTALAVYGVVRRLLDDMSVEVRTSRSQVAFRRRRGFAYLWLPGRYLRNPGPDVVLSIVLGRRDDSPRWKEVVRPSPGHWMHHLEVRDPAEIDDEVAAWLREAADRAG
jgi:hypothetical protein